MKSKKFRLFCLIALIVGLPVYYIFGSNSLRKTALSLVEIQSNLTDITLAKLAGNSVDAGKKVTIGYQNIANLSVPSFLQDYQQVAVIWGNKIGASSNNAKTWKNLSNQPGDFPLTLTDKQAQTFFQSSVKTIAELKKSGEEAIKNKNKEGMRLVAVKLLVQKHWLNGLLYSKKNGAVSLNLINPVFAVPAIGQVEDVTCRLCSDQGIRWTDKLRKQYSCDMRCKPRQTGDIKTQPTQEQNDQNENNSDNSLVDDIEKLESYTYKDLPKREVCIDNNTNDVFCVEDAVQSTNEIAASAIGFADGTKVLSVAQWGKNYEHLEGGLGVISTGKPDQPPKPKKSTNNSNNSGNPPPEIPVLNFNVNSGGGSGPTPVIDLERDTSAEQTNSSSRW